MHREGREAGRPRAPVPEPEAAGAAPPSGTTTRDGASALGSAGLAVTRGRGAGLGLGGGGAGAAVVSLDAASGCGCPASAPVEAAGWDAGSPLVMVGACACAGRGGFFFLQPASPAMAASSIRKFTSILNLRSVAGPSTTPKTPPAP